MERLKGADHDQDHRSSQRSEEQVTAAASALMANATTDATRSTAPPSELPARSGAQAYRREPRTTTCPDTSEMYCPSAATSNDATLSATDAPRPGGVSYRRDITYVRPTQRRQATLTGAGR